MMDICQLSIADPPLLLNQLLLHDGDMSSSTAEANPTQFEPETPAAEILVSSDENSPRFVSSCFRHRCDKNNFYDPSGQFISRLINLEKVEIATISRQTQAESGME
jgi:hypothetical protein